MPDSPTEPPSAPVGHPDFQLALIAMRRGAEKAIRLARVLCLVGAAFIASCKTSSSGGGGGGNGNALILPHFPIGAPVSVDFPVSNGQPTYPHWIYFRTREQSGSHPYTPFDRSEIRVSTIAPNGQKVASTVVRPVFPRIVDDGKYRALIFARNSVPSLTDYTVRVEVLRPSRRRYDKARIHLSRRK